MTRLFRKSMLSASVCLSALFAGQAVMAQEAVFVLATNEVGAPTYNPIKANNLNAATTLLFDRLVSQAADLSYHPWLAESWEEAADGMSWTFHLKSGVTFHNGEPFNAETIEMCIRDSQCAVEKVGGMDRAGADPLHLFENAHAVIMRLGPGIPGTGEDVVRFILDRRCQLGRLWLIGGFGIGQQHRQPRKFGQYGVVVGDLAGLGQQRQHDDQALQIEAFR